MADFSPSQKPPQRAHLSLKSFLRAARRLLLFIGIVLGCTSEYLFCLGITGRSKQLRLRSLWLNRWARRTLRAFNIRTHCTGLLPTSGLLVSNHLSYLDIVVYASLGPTVFLSKSEVRHWPVLGWLASMAGTLFIRRDKRSEVKRMAIEFSAVIEQNVLLAVFPEGTSTNGHQVLPFYSALLEPALERQWPVTPAWIGYTLEDGSVEDEICYWRDMTFLPHFLNLMSKEEIHAYVVIGTPPSKASDRKHLASLLHDQVCQMGRRYGSVHVQSPNQAGLDSPALP